MRQTPDIHTTYALAFQGIDVNKCYSFKKLDETYVTQASILTGRLAR